MAVYKQSKFMNKLRVHEQNKFMNFFLSKSHVLFNII